MCIRDSIRSDRSIAKAENTVCGIADIPEREVSIRDDRIGGKNGEDIGWDKDSSCLLYTSIRTPH